MAVYTIPTDARYAAFTEKVSLSGVVYQLGFRWNSRLACWMMDVAQADGTPVLYGLAVKEGNPTAARYNLQHYGLPPGLLVPVDLTGKHKEATADSFGSSVQMFYREPG